MKYFMITFLTIVLLLTGAVVGYYVRDRDNPKDLSVALAGCEDTASTVNKILLETEFDLKICNLSFDKCSNLLNMIVGNIEQD